MVGYSLDIVRLVAYLLTTHSALGLITSKLNIMTHANNLSTQEVETVGLGVQGHLWWHKKFASLGSIRHCLNVPSLLPQKEFKVILRYSGTLSTG